VTALELQKLFNKEIPITLAMGLTVVTASSSNVILNFKLADNRNHKGTAFGGSQYSACALACYGLFLVGIREKGFPTNNIVISDGEINYKAPVEDNFIATAIWPEKSRSVFFDKLTKKKKSKISLTAEISSAGKICTTFKGDFVAILD
jgi:thioesterase domain-containing protein